MTDQPDSRPQRGAGDPAYTADHARNAHSPVPERTPDAITGPDAEPGRMRASTAASSSIGGQTHGWTAIRQERVFFHNVRVRGAAQFICNSGIAEELQRLITCSTGRRRTCTVEGFLVGCALASRMRNGAVQLNHVTDILYWGIDAEWRRRFGLDDKPDNAIGFEAAYAVTRRLFHRLMSVMDPSPLPKNKQILKEDARQIIAAADPDELRRRRELLDRVAGQILHASHASVQHLLQEHWDGSLGVDATVIGTPARGTSTRNPLTSTDPDAGWYTRSGDHADPHDPNPAGSSPATDQDRLRGGRSGKFLFGYDAAIAVARNPHHDPVPGRIGDPAEIPALIMGLRLSKPGHMPGQNGIAVLSDIVRRGHPAGYVGADAAYNGAKEQDWQLPLRAMGYRPVYSYTRKQLGTQAQAFGAHLNEGTWYCPDMPDLLVDATNDLINRKDDDPRKIDKQTWRARIDARQPYALPRKGKPDGEGHQRFLCPASAGKVQCPRKPTSLGADPALPLISIKHRPVQDPPICRQTSITIAPEHGAKHWQPHPYGSAEWQRIYGRLRNSVEGINGYAKQDTYEAIERASGRRIRGIAAQTFLLAFQLAHANQRKISSWLDTLPGLDGTPRRRARRRKTKALGTWTPTGHIDEPPAA
ncbi:hypothetical protein [Actinomadura sp. NTSP31]|uniref:hypothetical protein n=1 Tax=Actinomadura sp. NTSP31 TaxID=1735447 RepID=UPI0035BEDF4C